MWELSSVGTVGPLRIGMSRAQVATALQDFPAVTRFTEKGPKTMQEFRTLAEPIIIYCNNNLYGVDFYLGIVGVTFEGLDLFKADPRDVLMALSKADGSPLIDYESILFPRLRLNTGDFYDIREKKFAQLDDVYNRRELSVFSPGSFDRFMAGYHPVDIEQLGKG